MDHHKASRDRRAGERWAAEYAEINPAGFHEMCDALVLGDFDWRDYFPRKPSSAFLNGVCDYEQQIFAGAA